ncbi:DEAD-box ATP-dependent RNA helicase 28 [Senna tora]|uniref:DEAD-box ATP-dependent RNA helicase 28 n=1 Tax=Senna tora TaxID=362788 RepID=A0A834T4Z4_9FABA|nr:DEAD-box ATP-dependent RNA helicase 28 [Senna tora]
MKSRIVADQSIIKWSHVIDQMEDEIAAVLQEEREERALRKAEMEATKAENMIEHKEEIYSRPKRTWFMTEKEKKLAAKAVKTSSQKEKSSGKEVISAEQAEELRMKEKRKREREKNLPRKKRRKLEATREMLEDEGHDEKPEAKGQNKKEKSGMSVVDLAYRRAKAAKGLKKALDAGKVVKKDKKKSNHSSQKAPSRTDEMRELFQSDMSEKRQRKSGGNKSKSSFKSKSRYKRR